MIAESAVCWVISLEMREWPLTCTFFWGGVLSLLLKNNLIFSPWLTVIFPGWDSIDRYSIKIISLISDKNKDLVFINLFFLFFLKI